MIKIDFSEEIQLLKREASIIEKEISELEANKLKLLESLKKDYDKAEDEKVKTYYSHIKEKLRKLFEEEEKLRPAEELIDMIKDLTGRKKRNLLVYLPYIKSIAEKLADKDLMELVSLLEKEGISTLPKLRKKVKELAYKLEDIRRDIISLKSEITEIESLPENKVWQYLFRKELRKVERRLHLLQSILLKYNAVLDFAKKSSEKGFEIEELVRVAEILGIHSLDDFMQWSKVCKRCSSPMDLVLMRAVEEVGIEKVEEAIEAI